MADGTSYLVGIGEHLWEIEQLRNQLLNNKWKDEGLIGATIGLPEKASDASGRPLK